MKKLILAMMIFLISLPLMGADATNQTVSYIEDDYTVLYYGTATFGAAGGTDNCYTQLMRIDFLDLTTYPATIQIWCTDVTGTEDVNGFIQFSNTVYDSTFKELGTDTGLDQIQTTVKFDTVGVCLGVKCYGAVYMRLKLDGQAGNPNSTPVNWSILFYKPERYAKTRLASTGDAI